MLTASTISTLPYCLINGIICGILGGLFVKINCWICIKRKKYITRKCVKPLEASFFVLLTVAVFFWLPKLYRVCRDVDDVANANKKLMVTYDCEKGQYNPFASLFFNSEGDALKSILSGFEGPGGINPDLIHMSIFLVVWYILPIITYGVWVPAGLFVPGMVIGVSVGAVM